MGWITVATAPVRMTMDRSTPSATHGIRLVHDLAPLELDRSNLINAKLILESSTPEVSIAYFGMVESGTRAWAGPTVP